MTLGTSSRSWLLAALLLLSGFCGISYEVLYARVLTNAIGDQFAVSASILVAFMLGIGLGTLYAHRLWRFLWLIEGGIGLFAVAFALSGSAIERAYYALSSGGSLSSAMVFCFVLLAGPAFLIGCSLPLFAGYLGRLTEGVVFARAYMIYNFGAALTVLAIEFGLFRLVGLRMTVLAMAALNGVAAVCLFTGFSDLRSRPETVPERLDLTRLSWLALALASVASAVFQLLMIKLAECFLGPFRETFALVLAVVLLGIASGSAVVRRFKIDLAWLLALAGFGLIALLADYDWVTRGYALLRPATVPHALLYVILRVAALVLLMGVPVMAFGATVPALARRLGATAHDSGRLLFVSSMGNVTGFLLMAFVLHRTLDYGVLIIVVGVLTALAVVFALGGNRRAVLAGAALLAGLIAVHRVRWDEKLLYFGYEAFNSVEELDWYRDDFISTDHFKGRQDVFALNRMGNEVFFFINGFVSINLESPAERIVGAFPALFAPRTDKAFVLGVGSGITTGTLALIFDHVDGVEINPVVLQNLHRMSDYNFNLASRSNARLVVDDGIHFAKVTPERYSLIVSTVTSPRYFSSSKLYTKDFFETIKRRLTQDGVYVTWVDLMVGQRGLDIMLKTATSSFRHCSLAAVNSGYLLLLCSDEPLKLRQPEVAARSEPLASYLRKYGLRPEWLPYGLLTTNARDAIRDADVPFNTIDYPALEFQAARMADRDFGDFADHLVNGKLSLDDVAGILRPAMGFDPMHLVLHNEHLLGDSLIADAWLSHAEEQDDEFAERHRAARLEYRAWMARASDSAEAHQLYGFDLLLAGRFDEAVDEAHKSLERDPERADAHRIIGHAREKAGNLEEAEESFRQAFRLDGGDVEAALALGRIYYKRGDYARALVALERAEAESEPDPTPSQIYHYKALALEALGRPREAENARKLEQEAVDD